jgi:hypothetical protein
MINKLAEIYYNQGVKPGQISRKIAENTGYSSKTVWKYLDDKYKIETSPKGPRESLSDRVSPSPVVEEAKRVLGEEKFEQLLKQIGRTETAKAIEPPATEAHEPVQEKPSPQKEMLGTMPLGLGEVEEPETYGGLEQTVERFLHDYKEALKKAPKEIKRDDVQIAIGFFKRLIKDRGICCPICGETRLVWRCGHEF